MTALSAGKQSAIFHQVCELIPPHVGFFTEVCSCRVASIGQCMRWTPQRGTTMGCGTALA